MIRLTLSKAAGATMFTLKPDRSDIDWMNVREVDRFIFCFVSPVLIEDTVDFWPEIFTFLASFFPVPYIVSTFLWISIFFSSSSSSSGLPLAGFSNSSVTRSREFELSACQEVVWRNFPIDLLSPVVRSVVLVDQAKVRPLLLVSYVLHSDSFVSRMASAAVPVTETLMIERALLQFRHFLMPTLVTLSLRRYYNILFLMKRVYWNFWKIYIYGFWRLKINVKINVSR